MSRVIYARVPDTLKAATDSYAQEHGVTLTSAVVDLLEKGLIVASDKQSFSGLQQGLAVARAENTELRAQVRALEVLKQRRGQVLGACQNCSTAVSAYQLFVAGSCEQCGHGLSNMLTPLGSSGVDQKEMLLLLGLVAALFGAAWIDSKTT